MIRFSRMKNRGFSLIELIMVIVLIGILSFWVAARLPGNMNVPSQAEQLAGDIRYAQSLSMTRGQRYRINFTASTYQITDMAGVPVIHPGTGGTAPVNLNGVSLSGYNPPLTSNYLAFDGKGTPYINATTILAGNAVVTLSGGGASRTVTISPETGKATIP